MMYWPLIYCTWITNQVTKIKSNPAQCNAEVQGYMELYTSSNAAPKTLAHCETLTSHEEMLHLCGLYVKTVYIHIYISVLFTFM